MSTNTKKERQSPYYVCPVCKQSLTPATNGLCCQRDGVEYSVKNGIPDFVTDDLTKSASVVLRSVDKLDDLAEIYEGPSYYGVLDMANAELGLPSIEEGAKAIAEMVDVEGGVGLDVACGTGYVTRPLAQKMRLVYGIDISMGMLEKATEYAQGNGIENICFARSGADRLPFPDEVFDGVTCIGALHLFPDTAEALKEMARVVKKGRRLAALTIVKQDLSVLKKWSELISERMAASNFIGEGALGGKHLFDVEELDTYLTQAGFKGFAYDIYGFYILFHAEKG